MHRRYLLNISRTLIVSTGLTAVLLTALPSALAQTAAPTTTTATASPLVDAEVRKVDAAAGKITLKHGDIPHLDMPGMTMVFQVKDTSQLDSLKAGDRVQFRADKVLGAYVASDIVPKR